MSHIVINAKDIALVAESVLILVALVALLIREIAYRVRLRRSRRAAAEAEARRPAERAARRAYDKRRFDEIAGETSYSIEEIPHKQAVARR